MTTAAGGTIIWRDIVQARTEIGMKTVDLVDMVYTDAEFLRKKLEEVVDAVSEQCIEKLGFDTHNTYLLDEDYIKKSRHKINIADKLNELNVLRYENFISSIDYDKTKHDLIEKAKGTNGAGLGTETKLSSTAITGQAVK